MKKRIYILILSLTTLSNSFGQEKEVYIERIVTDERILQGRIDGKHEIEIYLKYHQMSDEHKGIYSVKGWYYYEKVKKKIPLVGICDGGLILYVFKEKAKNDTVLNFESNKEHFWDRIEYVKNMEGYDEKFSYPGEYASKSGEWKTKTKKLSLEIYNNDYNVFDETELLKIKKNNNEEKTIHLKKLNIYESNFELVSYIKNQSGVKVLLHYDCPSAVYVNGMCGAGSEVGYIILKYNTDFILQDIQKIKTESCLLFIYSEEMKQSNKNIKVFNVNYNSGETKKKITIDIQNIDIKIE